MQSLRQMTFAQVCWTLLLATIGGSALAQDMARLTPEHPHGKNIQKQRSLKSVLTDTERRFKVYFIFESDLVRNKYVDPNTKLTDNLEESLRVILHPLGLQFRKTGENYYAIVSQHPTQAPEKAVGLLPMLNLTAGQSVSMVDLNIRTLALTISGRITDEKNEPIVGASILEKGTTNGTSTDAQGRFSLNVAGENAVLVVSFVGYTTQEVPVGGRTQFDLQLAPDEKTLQEVVVVGSRANVARTNIETPVPVDIIGAREIKAFAQTDVTQILNFIAPSFSSNRQTVADGTDHIDPASLRGLGPDQVLVLLNGKRRHTTALLNINGTFGRGTVGTDMNALPAGAIERIEVLRDGAAAQYGSDAIAGVINIVLKRQTPWSATAFYGQSVSRALGRNHYDGKTFQFDLSKGWALGDKGYINFSGQYLGRGETNRGGLDTRPLLYRALPTPAVGETEAAFQARYRGLKQIDDATAQANGLDRNNMRVGNSSTANLGAFLNVGYKLSSAAEVYATVGSSRRTGEAAGFYRIPSASAQIDLRIYPNGFLPLINTTIWDYSALAGVKGKVGGWDYDLSHTFGGNSIRYDISNTLNASIANVADNQKEFYAGTLRFQQNTTNLDLSRRLEFDSFLSSLNVAFGGEFRLDNYRIEAGEERSWSRGFPNGQNFDPNKAAGSQVFPGFKPTNALNQSRNSQAGYIDLEGEFGPKLLVGVAGRFENFSDFGNNFSYKATARYKFFEDFAVRGAVATGFRAPSLHQRFFNNESTQFVNSLPLQVLTLNNDNPIVRRFGVESLKPEISTSYSVGLTGKLLGRLTFTIDAYQIEIRDRIVFSSQYERESGPVTSGIVNTFLNTIDPPDANGVVQINSVQFFTNAINTRTRGLDVVISDRISLNTTGASLALTAAANFNETEVTRIQGSSVIESNQRLKELLFNRTERSRYESSVPRNKINLSATFDNPKWNIALRTVRFGEVTFLNADPPFLSDGQPRLIGSAGNVPYPPENDQTFSAKWVTDLTVGYKFNKMLTLTVGANNLFDIYPDRAYINPRNNENNLSGIPNQRYAANLDNTSNGRFLYSRAVTQFGFNGRFVFAKLGFTL